MRLSRPLRIGLVLGGGGARGSAHAGVIAALERAGIRADFVVGTSMGAFMGAAYALDPDPERLMARVHEAMELEAVQRLEREFQAWIERGPTALDGFRGWLQGMVGKVRKLVIWNRQAVQSALVPTELLSELALWLVGDVRFEDLRVPFYAVAFDLISNQTVVFGSGLVRTALAASAAIPGVFEPVRIGDRVLADGCVLEELPADIARGLGADFVIAVDVSQETATGAPRSGAESVGRVLQIRAEWIRKAGREAADIVIRPEVAGVHWSEFGRSRECMKAGERAVAEVADELRERLKRVERSTLFRRVFGKTPPPRISVESADPVPPGTRRVANGEQAGDAAGAPGTGQSSISPAEKAGETVCREMERD